MPSCPTGVLRDGGFHAQKFWLAAGSAAGMAFYAGENSGHELEIAMNPPRFPACLTRSPGLKIVQISDFHFHEYTEAAFVEGSRPQGERGQPGSRRDDRGLR